MHVLTAVILAADDEQRTLLQMLVDGATIARTAFSAAALPSGAKDPLLRRIAESKPDVIILDIPARPPEPALRAIELLQQESPAPIFAVGEMSQPQVIVTAMRSGAREFIARPTSPNEMLEAFVRLSAARRKSEKSARGRVFTVINAKGGCGATTVAVNTALALHAPQKNVVLVDLAPLGHCALHLNVKPSFTIADAVRNLHRLDGSLLESFITRSASGMPLLAGISEPAATHSSSPDLAKLFDVLVNQYEYVLVDASTRLDPVMRVMSELSDMVLLVAHADVTSLWSAARIQQYLTEAASRDRVRLVLNRFRRIPGFSESDAENLTGAKLLCKIPNHYPAVSSAIDRGLPIVTQNHSDLARAFTALASALASAKEGAKPRSWSLSFTAA
jgi:pilus assembly protein CpaE